MSTGSLVVKISADINSFSRELNKMTKDVDKAAKKLTEIGKGMTLGITLPAALAAVALGKMAVENEAVAGKMQRSFGPALSQMNTLIEHLMAIVPETATDLQKLATNTNDFARGLGMAAPKAELLTEQMMKMAADISSRKMIDYADALDIVQKGLSGQTRGLKQAGIVIDQAQIKQEAYRLGLLRVGHELTPLGTALATYSLMTKQLSQVQGDANASWNDTGRQLAFAKRDLMEFFDATSNLMIPAIRLLARVLKGAVDALNKLPDWLRQSVLVFGGFLAVLGPTIILVAKLTQAITVLRAAMTLLAAGSALKKLIAVLTAPEVLLGLAALAVALGIGIALWKKYHKEVKGIKPELDGLLDVKSLLGGATDADNKSPLQSFQEHARQTTTYVTDLIAMTNGPLGKAQRMIVDLNAQALDLYDKQTDKLGEMAQAARQVARETQTILSAMILMATFDFPDKGGLFTRQQHMQMQIGVQSRRTTSDNELKLNAANQMIGDETTLRMRELLLTLPPVFNAVRLAAVDLGEQFRKAHQDLSVSFEKFKMGYGSTSGLGNAASAGLQAGLAGALDSLGPFALAMTAVGKIMQGFMPILDKLFAPLVVLGQIIATMITPVLKLLFVPLKLLGIVVAFLGEIVARVTAAIATAIATVLTGIGKALNMIPFLHLGNGLIAAGNALRGYAASQYEAADQLKRQRKDLQRLQFDDAAEGLNNFTSATNRASDAIINAASTFKLNLAKFNARDFDQRAPLNLSAYYPNGTSGTATPNGLATPAGASTKSLDGKTPLANITLDGKVVAQVTVDHLRTAASRQYGDASRIKDVVVVGT